MKNNSPIISGIKIGLGIIAGIGIEFICGAFGGQITKIAGGNKAKKVAMHIGSAVIGGMIAKAADDYISDQVDNTVEFIGQIGEAINKNKEEEIDE